MKRNALDHALQNLVYNKLGDAIAISKSETITHSLTVASKNKIKCIYRYYIQQSTKTNIYYATTHAGSSWLPGTTYSWMECLKKNQIQNQSPSLSLSLDWFCLLTLFYMFSPFWNGALFPPTISSGKSNNQNLHWKLLLILVVCGKVFNGQF